MTITFGGCRGQFGTWAGTASLVFGSAGECTLASTGGLMNIGAAGTMTLTSSAGLTLTAASTSYYVEEDSSSSGYSTAESGGLVVTCGGTDCSTSRTVNILGLHRAYYNSSGTELADHTINTSTPFTITGTGSSKQVTAGVVVLQHNLSRYIATSTISSTLKFSANCCLPTSGTITTTFSGTKTGSESVTFSSCGQASVNGSSISLAFCI